MKYDHVFFWVLHKDSYKDYFPYQFDVLFNVGIVSSIKCYPEWLQESNVFYFYICRIWSAGQPNNLVI